MAYSKIFSGDLPEITNEIIQYLKKDLTTLYSCIFVNRLWCRLAIPLLWENPFSFPTKNYRCIEIYLSYLNDDDKTKFNGYEIINNLLPSNTLLFNYPSFIKCLNLGTIYISTKEWVSTLLDDDREKLEELVYRSLFEVLIKNEGILHSFEIVMFADFIQQINKIIKPFKLKTLFMKEISHFNSLQFLLKKFGNYLENFEFGSMREEYEVSRKKLLGLIINYCTNIKRFTSDKPDDNNIYLLIENIGQTINYINIDLNLNYSDDLGLIILQNLGQVLPTKLDYLSLSLSFNIKDFEIFLKNSQNTFIKKLLIRNIMKNDDKSILSYIKKYIMMKERVKYLACLELIPFSNNTNKDLYFLKDEVNEFKLHNIVVRKYFDLCIFIKDIIYNK
ncbi:hypothetical protein C1646_741813 [Rhizophagus diaphanus]|nr:hypothetical protein C1646_741813 [Rhizophagus diaphanus] [Rhizophagus sp. MUCL 43196]